MTTMLYGNVVAGDLAMLRFQMQDRAAGFEALTRRRLWRPLCDILIDWAVMLGACAAVLELGPWLVPLALLLIGSRQRALGNILHDGSHGNLHAWRALNDAVVTLLVALPLFTSLRHYRRDHYAHHRELGDTRRDPDLLPVRDGQPWLPQYAQFLMCGKTWRSSITGHLFCSRIGLHARLRIVAWWLAFLLLLVLAVDELFAAVFVALWLGARATAFHCITMFREMCDHFGLVPGNIVSFTRDFVSHGPVAWLIHPHNNGYHLTHHLLPAVPYYNLPRAQRLLAKLPLYRSHDRTFSAYVFGRRSVVASWRAGVQA
jgi:fatty acid desaturase